MTLHLENLRFAYGRTVVLDGVTWTVRRGVTGLLGPNGAGKTTLLNLVVGLTTPSSGTISYCGPQGENVPLHRTSVRIGFVPQRFSVAGEMRVRDTVGYAAWTNGVASRDCAAAAIAALRKVQLEDRAGDRVRQLSGGQRQRLGLAAALAHEPDVVVLDEPTVGLDPGQRLRIRETIAEIGRDRVVLLSTHLIEDVAHVCSRVGVLARGRLAFDGTESELSARLSNTAPTGTLGSVFERSYQALVDSLGAQAE